MNETGHGSLSKHGKLVQHLFSGYKSSGWGGNKAFPYPIYWLSLFIKSKISASVLTVGNLALLIGPINILIYSPN